MDKKKIEEDIRNSGYEVEDFKIEIRGNSVAIIPKPSYEIRKIAKQCDKPVIEDVNVVAETTVATMNDVNDVAETVAFLISEIKALKYELEVLKNG